MKTIGFWIVYLGITIFLTLFSFQKINMATADLGRHIQNGYLLTHTADEQVTFHSLLHTNFFSNTYPNFPFVNHHWGSGILAYFIYLYSGFAGLSFIYYLLILSALLLTLYSVRPDVSLEGLLFGGLFLVPLIADRTEIRPEGISYFFIAIFLCILYYYSQKKISKKILFVLPILQILWSNLHIYFIFGPFLIGLFLFESIIRKEWVQMRNLGAVLFATFLATLCTPYGLTGALYPFTMFGNYGYMIIENQSIPFLENIGFQNPTFLWFKISLLCLSVFSLWSIWRQGKKAPIALIITSTTFAVLAFLGIRHITAYALVSLPLIIFCANYCINFLKRKLPTESFWALYTAGIIILVITTSIHFSNRLPWNRPFGLGLLPHITDSIEFIRSTGIHGPIFNNYDIGGMMIFGLYPTEKVFVDNRPETYPTDFFKKIYIPMQEDNTIWQSELQKEKFNIIYFYRLDMTPWAQKFLLTRITDPDWAPIYVDDYTVIFIRRVKENEKIIIKYELPQNMFVH